MQASNCRFLWTFMVNDEGSTVKCRSVLVMWPVESLFFPQSDFLKNC